MPFQICSGALTIAILLAASICLTVAVNNDGLISSVRVVGSVFCDTCFRKEFSKNSYFIKGAPLAVECETGKEGPNFRIEGNTNEHGQFEVELPASIFNSETHLKRCSAMLLKKEGPCRVASMANSSSFTLKSKQGGIHTYSAGFFTYRPQTIPPSCFDEVANLMSKEIEVPRRSEFESSKQIRLPPPFSPSVSPPPFLTPPSLLPPFGFPPIPFPTLSPPQIPILQPPPIGNLPNPFQPPSVIPPIGNMPNPFQPPSVIPPIGNLPNPFQPPSGFPFPPNPFQPPAPLIPFPPFPFPFPFMPPTPHTLKGHSTQP